MPRVLWKMMKIYEIISLIHETKVYFVWFLFHRQNVENWVIISCRLYCRIMTWAYLRNFWFFFSFKEFFKNSSSCDSVGIIRSKIFKEFSLAVHSISVVLTVVTDHTTVPRLTQESLQAVKHFFQNSYQVVLGILSRISLDFL